MIDPALLNPMSAHRYMEEISLAAILANNSSTGVTPEVNLRYVFAKCE